MGLSIHQWIEQGKDLPVLSGSIGRIINLTQESESDVSEIAKVIKMDVGLSAAILRIANSSAFGLINKITTIDQAVVLLGFNAVRSIALAVGVVNLFPPNGKRFLSKIWQRSLLTGIAARELVKLTGKRNTEDAFTCGLLHDIGLIALYVYDNEKASEILNRAESDGRMTLEEERRSAGIDHTELGGLLAEKWMLPDLIHDSIVHHHEEPVFEINSSTNNHFSHCVYLGSLVGGIFYFGRKEQSINKFMEGSTRLMGISSEDADNLLHNIHPQLVEIASHFDIAIGSGNTYEEIICKLNEEIAAITVANEAVKSHLTRAFKRERELAARLDDANRKLKVLASKDSLTGLYNRQFLDEMLEKEWQRSIRHYFPLALVMIDIDDFKRVNDTFGHKAGDAVLMKLALGLVGGIRKNDFLARYGGEEFALVLPQTDLENACKVAQDLLEMARGLKIPLLDRKLSLTISCGVSSTRPRNYDITPDVLIQSADDALYSAKRAGKNRIAAKAATGNPKFALRDDRVSAQR